MPASFDLPSRAPSSSMEHLRPPVFEPCRPAYPELVTFAVPRGEREWLKDLAREKGTSVSALVRQAVERAFSRSQQPEVVR